MKQILDKIQEYDKIIILGHTRPDGDCYGSQFGLKDIINTTYPNKKVIVTGDISNYVSFLGDMEIISDEEFKGALVIIVDTGSLNRLYDKRYELADYSIRIDHHIPEDKFTDFEWVDPSYASCTLMITDFFNEFKNELKITSKGAKALYTGIVTDTGRFRYDSVNSKTFILSSILLDNGVNVNEIDKLLSSESLETLRLRGHVLSNFITTKNGFIYVKFDKEIISKFNVSLEDIASQVNILANIDGYPVWALLVEYDTEIRIRLRSNGPTINEFAGKYDGGGHAKASGAKLNSWDDLDKFVDDVDTLVKEYKKTL